MPKPKFKAHEPTDYQKKATMGLVDHIKDDNRVGLMTVRHRASGDLHTVLLAQEDARLHFPIAIVLTEEQARSFFNDYEMPPGTTPQIKED